MVLLNAHGERGVVHKANLKASLCETRGGTGFQHLVLKRPTAPVAHAPRARLLEHFPEEVAAIDKYIRLLSEVETMQAAMDRASAQLMASLSTYANDEHREHEK